MNDIRLKHLSDTDYVCRMVHDAVRSCGSPNNLSDVDYSDGTAPPVFLDRLCGFERAVHNMIAGWLEYAETHQAEYESAIGDDGVLGPAWQAIGEGILGLLNGQTGRFDCGKFDALIRDTAKANDAEIEG